jgi:alkaline phosphatase D
MLKLNQLPQAVRHEGGISRRLFLAYCSALAATPWLARAAAEAAAPVVSRPSFGSDPFTLGLSSGDPDATGVVLWTRLAPRPLLPDGGMSDAPVEVSWELAEDEAMKRVVKHGIATAAPELAHSVHVEVDGLQPDRWYWYRFRSGDAETKIARTRTLPAASASPAELRFAFASCQHYESGYYTAYQHMAKDDGLDLVMHLGDYIYEPAAAKGRAREHANGKCVTLADYRIRHAQYRTDEHLQAAHRICPWFVTWDDHEVSNNYAGDRDGHERAATQAFLQRRAAAYKAYYEHMPLRARSIPRGPDMQLFRKASYGTLAELLVLDGRQYRTPQPNGSTPGPLGAAALDPRGTMLGTKQKQWLKDSLLHSQGKWNVLGNNVTMCMIARPRKDDPKVDYYGMDQWPAYAHERIELMQFMADHKVANPIVITGDIHSNFVNELRVDDRKHDRPVVATEFIGTSISSGGDGVAAPAGTERLMGHNPGIKFHNAERGYVRCTVTPKAWRSDYVTVAKITVPNEPVTTRASFVVESGKPRVEKA